MDLTFLKKNRSLIIILILFLFMGIALVLRAIPSFFIHDPGYLYIYDTDSWYSLRQIEVMVKNFPQYNWFDPMTAYPTGKIIDWGPLFPFIAATLSLLTGATTHSGIVFTSGWIAPLMAMAMVPIMFLVGKTVWNWKAGLVAAGLISVVSIQYFSFSTYGWVDHHIAEVLFSTLFFLAYIFTLLQVKGNQIDSKNWKTFIIPVFLSAITGIIFFLALLSSTTVILSLIIVAVYMFVQYILDYFSKQNSTYLLVVNSIVFLIPIILLFLFGFRQESLALTQYSSGIIYAHLALVAETIVLFILSVIFKERKIGYIVSLVSLLAICLVLIQIFPLLQMVIDQMLGLIFGLSVYSVAVVETLPWTLSGAWENFTFSLILMTGGLLVLVYTIIKKRTNQSVFLLVWSLVMLLLTIRFQRFVYYFTVNVVLLSALCIVEPISWKKEPIMHHLAYLPSFFFKSPVPPSGNNSGNKPIPKKKDKKKEIKSTNKNQVNYPGHLKDIVVIAILILTICLIGYSVSQDIRYGFETPQHEIPSDWIESLTWLESNTPQTGIDYFRSYEEHGFSYPPESYGIMAVWDAGHWITFFAHRIPITNPFQDNLGGSSGAAAYFLSQNESQANEILTSLGGKYVITNSDMSIDTFTNLVPWPSGSVDISPYIKWFLLPDSTSPKELHKIHLYDRSYFDTIVVRLHNFDGSIQIPETEKYVQYEIRQVPAAGETSGDVTGYARVITSEQEISVIDNNTRIVPEGPDIAPGRYADTFSDLPNRSLQNVPALKHYRLIHESPKNASVKIFPESDILALPDVKYVKIFEYVKGAHISGEGIIEVPIMTNTGRTFVYQQKSENGEFVVPYSTTGNPNSVHASGQYHIVGTSHYFEVGEEDVTKGNRIPG
jgi:dolichyl-phosphooligosaccharide-protein glycotransferase